MIKIVKKFILILVLVIFIGAVFYIYKELRPQKPEEIKLVEDTIKAENTNTEIPPIEEKPKENLLKPKLLYEKILLYPKIDYPYIYGYDPESKTIKEINIEDKTYKEIYKQENIKTLSFSEDKTKFIFKKEKDYYLLDTLNDKIEKLPRSVKKFFWFKNDLYVYILTKDFSYLAIFKKSLEPFIDLYILNPEFEVLQDGILVYENLKFSYSSPLIFINRKKEKKFLLNNSLNLSVISNKKDLIYVSVLDKEWKSYLLDIKGNKLKEFNFGTLREKCTFEKVLICGVPLNQNIVDLTRWYYYKDKFNDRIVIFEPIKNELKYFDLDGEYDILQPTITSIGIIFLNRFDNKLYVVPIENFSF